MKIHIVSEADYEGRYIPIKAFFNKLDADEFVAEKRYWVERMLDKFRPLQDHYYSCQSKLNDELKSDCKLCQEYLDLNFSEDDIRYYTVQEVECE